MSIAGIIRLASGIDHAPANRSAVKMLLAGIVVKAVPALAMLVPVFDANRKFTDGYIIVHGMILSCFLALP